MKLKLKASEMQALRQCLLESVEFYDRPKLERKEALIKACLEEMWCKVDKQLAGIQQPRYSLEVKPSWALALLIDFQGNYGVGFEGNLMHKICNQLDKEYA